MIKICKDCDREFVTNNRHRKNCYECKKIYPMQSSGKTAPPFNRKLMILKDLKKKVSKLVNPNKIKEVKEKENETT